jgi:hypothetical protein
MRSSVVRNLLWPGTMKNPARVVASLSLVLAIGCGSVSNGGGGGADAAAGSTGAAGHGTAGSTGTAGHGTAGSTGSAGTGTAGSTGAAGQGSAGSSGAAGQGSAGSSGAAGHAGSNGSGGHDGGAGAGCNDLSAQYAQAITAARACTPSAANQCQQLVSSSLSACFSNCMTYVNDAAGLADLKAAWLAAGCNSQPVACPAIACLQPVAGDCVAGDGGGGTCSSSTGIR